MAAFLATNAKKSFVHSGFFGNFAVECPTQKAMTNNISHHISTLLRRNDCVIIPGVGAFVATRREAALVGDVLTPPAREITFNPAMTHDDGLLAASVSRRMKISFEQARERVGAEAALLQRRLTAEGAVTIARVGTLRRRSGGRIEFRPAPTWSLALPAIKAVKPAPAFEVLEPAAAAATAGSKAVAVVRVPLRLRWLRVAAAAAVLCVLGFTLSTPIDITTARHASLAAPSFTPPEEPAIEAPASPAGMELRIATAPEAGFELAARPRQSAPKPYVVVVGSLPSRSKALEFIERNSDIAPLAFMQSGEKFRVYAADGDSPEAARTAANSISGFTSRFPDAWVCRR